MDFIGGSRISRGGGVDPLGGAWTPNAGTLRQKCVQKRKNWVPSGGACAGGTPPLDPPMDFKFTDNETSKKLFSK